MKIIASDYDGTLNFGGIDDNKRQAIARWRSAGNLFVLVSGRHSANVRQLHIDQRFPCDYFIGSNGAVIRNSKNEVLHADCCAMEMLLPLIRFLFELGCPFALVHGAQDWFFTYPVLSPTAREPACTLETMPDVAFYTQVTTQMSTDAEAAAVTRQVKERFGAWFNPLQNGTSVDIVAAGVNKARGLSRLLELVDAGPEDMITVGDNTNDADMLAAYRSYAMENGVPSIRELADFVTPGVAELIARELELENGTMLHAFRIPVPGVRKKVIYHFSDVHLSVSDALSTPEEVQKAKNAASGWESGRLWFAEHYGEPAEEVQKKAAPEHFSHLLKLSEEGDAVILAGDLCEYVSPANLRFLDSELETCSIPWMSVCGNHDQAEDIPEGYAFSRTKQSVQLLDLGDLLILGFDDSRRGIIRQQNELLKAALALGKPIIIVLHIPIMTEDNEEILLQCGEYFRLNHPEADGETLAFIDTIKAHAGQIAAVLAGHLHFGNVSEIVPGLKQYVSSQAVLGNINRYEIGE